MCSTCNNVDDMSKMIQLRHVPDALHRKLKARAARKGMSLSDYLVSELTPIAELPTMEEWSNCTSASRLRFLSQPP